MGALGSWPGCPLTLISRPIDMGGSISAGTVTKSPVLRVALTGFYLRCRGRLLVLGCSSE